MSQTPEQAEIELRELSAYIGQLPTETVEMIQDTMAEMSETEPLMTVKRMWQVVQVCETIALFDPNADVEEVLDSLMVIANDGEMMDDTT